MDTCAYLSISIISYLYLPSARASILLVHCSGNFHLRCASAPRSASERRTRRFQCRRLAVGVRRPAASAVALARSCCTFLVPNLRDFAGECSAVTSGCGGALRSAWRPTTGCMRPSPEYGIYAAPMISAAMRIGVFEAWTCIFTRRCGDHTALSVFPRPAVFPCRWLHPLSLTCWSGPWPPREE